MNRLLIVYLATGNYKYCFDKFNESLKNLCPNSDKKVVALTDDSKYFNDRGIDAIKVRSYPWPIITLFKFHYVKEILSRYLDYNPTHICQFNSNIVFRKPITEDEFLSDKLTAVRHWELASYPEDYLPNKYANKNKNSVCYFENPTDYVHAGIWCCPKELINKLCDEVIELINTDLSHNVIPDWHDESAYNKVVVDEWMKNNLVNVLGGKYIGCSDDYYTIQKNDPKMTLDKVDKSILMFKENKHD